MAPGVARHCRRGRPSHGPVHQWAEEPFTNGRRNLQPLAEMKGDGLDASPRGLDSSPSPLVSGATSYVEKGGKTRDSMGGSDLPAWRRRQMTGDQKSAGDEEKCQFGTIRLPFPIEWEYPAIMNYSYSLYMLSKRSLSLLALGNVRLGMLNGSSRCAG